LFRALNLSNNGLSPSQSSSKAAWSQRASEGGYLIFVLSSALARNDRCSAAQPGDVTKAGVRRSLSDIHQLTSACQPVLIKPEAGLESTTNSMLNRRQEDSINRQMFSKQVRRSRRRGNDVKITITDVTVFEQRILKSHK